MSIQLFVSPWTGACQDPLSMEIPRQEYWSGLPLPSLGHLPNPEIQPESPPWQAYSLPPSHHKCQRYITDNISYLTEAVFVCFLHGGYSYLSFLTMLFGRKSLCTDHS